MVLRAGKVEQVGTPLSLYDDPDTMFVAGFIGSPKMNFLAAQIVKTANGQATVALTAQPDTTVTLPLSAPVTIGQKISLGIRPEHFLSEGEGDAQLQVDVDVTENLGSTSFVYARLQSGEALIAEQRARSLGTRPSSITLGISASQCLLFDETGLRLR